MGEAEKQTVKMSTCLSVCDDKITGVAYGGCCDEARLGIQMIRARKDERGNLLIQINGEGPWLSATYNNGVITFSY